MADDSEKSVSLQALQEAVRLAGSQSALADKVNEYLLADGRDPTITQRHVWNWLNRQHETPADCVLAVEAATGVSRYRLRRDVFGRAPRPSQATGAIAGGCSQ